MVALSAGCTELDDPPVWVDFDYQVRCVRCIPMAPSNDPHRIHALDGDDGLAVSCKAEDGRITVSVDYDEEGTNADWSFRLSGVDVSDEGPGNACSLSVKEAASEYIGACTDGDPTAEAPCQVELTRDDAVISGEIYCVNIPNRVDQTITRHVTRPGSDTRAFAFEVQNCEGL